MNLWRNMSIEDIASFWRLENKDWVNYVYFQEIQFDGNLGKDILPIRALPQEVMCEIEGRSLERDYKSLAWGSFAMFLGSSLMFGVSI